MAKMLQAKDVAAIANVDAKYFRSFLRDVFAGNTPGMGGRYVIAESDVETLLARFDIWRQSHKAGRTILIDVSSMKPAE